MRIVLLLLAVALLAGCDKRVYEAGTHQLDSPPGSVGIRNSYRIDRQPRE